MSDRHQDEDTVTSPSVRMPSGLQPAPTEHTRTGHARPPVSAPVRDGLWDANDVAAYLKVSRSWVYHRAEAGLLPCIRVGALLRFAPEAIRAAARGEGTPRKRIVAFGVK